MSSRIPEGKFFFKKLVVPILLVMSVGTAGLILFALAVILGYVNF